MFQMLDRVIEREVRQLLSRHEAVYGEIRPPVPVSAVGTDTMGCLVGDIPDPRAKMRPDTRPSYTVSGVLLCAEQEIWLRASDHPHRKRFSLAHELGHAYLHTDFRAGPGGLAREAFACGDREIAETLRAKEPVEYQANNFASELLLPTHLLKPAIMKEDMTLALLLSLAEQFYVSPVCMAIRVAREAWQPYAMVVSSDGTVEFSFCSQAMRAFSRYEFIHKGAAVDPGTETAGFFRKPGKIAAKDEGSHIVDSSRWFARYDGEQQLVEEVKGLGYGKVLTILTPDYDPVSNDEDGLD